MKRLEQKTALISGAARGIGRAFAAAYIREGAQMAINDIDIERPHATAAEPGDASIVVEMDVTRQSNIDAAVAETATAFGQIDILINNAALFTAAPVVEIEREDYARVFDINLAGTLFTMQTGMVDGGHWDRVDTLDAKLENKEPGQKQKEVAAGVPHGRMGNAQDLTGMAVYLASDEASYIVGQTNNVDGGQWLS